MQSHSRSAPEQLCNAFCPTSRTKIFLGSDIGKAVAADGTRYANLGTAFLYRDRIVADCTCNGKSNLGLASISIDADPTLRAGDVIVTAHGTVAAAAKSATQTATGTADAPDARRSADALPRLASQARALSSQ
jgi:hypothetical protein